MNDVLQLAQVCCSCTTQGPSPGLGCTCASFPGRKLWRLARVVLGTPGYGTGVCFGCVVAGVASRCLLPSLAAGLAGLRCVVCCVFSVQLVAVVPAPCVLCLGVPFLAVVSALCYSRAAESFFISPSYMTNVSAAREQHRSREGTTATNGGPQAEHKRTHRACCSSQCGCGFVFMVCYSVHVLVLTLPARLPSLVACGITRRSPCDTSMVVPTLGHSPSCIGQQRVREGMMPASKPSSLCECSVLYGNANAVLHGNWESEGPGRGAGQHNGGYG